MSYGIAFTQSIYVLIFISDKIRRKEYDLVPTSIISKILNIPRPSVVKLLQSLHQEGLIVTGSGKNGGARTALPPEEITLDRVFKAIEGSKPLFRMDHSLNASGPRPDSASREMAARLKLIEDEMILSLSKTSIASLLENMDKYPE